MIGEFNFNVCATFKKKDDRKNWYANMEERDNDNWSHEEGYYCFSRSVDTINYPVMERNR